MKASKNNTPAASGLPAMRNTLVVPGFLEPWLLGSGKLNKRHNKIALDIEPNKYAAVIKQNTNLKSIGDPMLHRNIIFINELRINTTIGKDAWEREIEQPVIINISLTTDWLSIIDHQLIINLITDFCKTNTFQLLEDLAIKLEKLILTQYAKNIQSLQISAKTLFPAINTKEIGVTIERTYPPRTNS